MDTWGGGFLSSCQQSFQNSLKLVVLWDRLPLGQLVEPRCSEDTVLSRSQGLKSWPIPSLVLVEAHWLYPHCPTDEPVHQNPMGCHRVPCDYGHLCIPHFPSLDKAKLFRVHQNKLVHWKATCLLQPIHHLHTFEPQKMPIFVEIPVKWYFMSQDAPNG